MLVSCAYAVLNERTFHVFRSGMLLAALSLFVYAPATRASDRPFVHFAPTVPAAPCAVDTGDAVGIPWCTWKGPTPARLPLPISADFLSQKLRELSGEVAVRIDGKRQVLSERATDEGLRLARAWLRQQYTDLGFVVAEHGGWGGTNFIAEKPGEQGDKVVIVSSHMDAVDDVPGADDDGAGTVTALAVAQALASQTFRHTLRIVAFDQEELGLVGSSEYVANLQERGEAKRVLADIQLEMTGYNPHKRNNFHVIDCNKKNSRALSALVMNAVKVQKLPLTRVSACTDASDHASFWGIHRPAIVISENFFGGDGNPCYHQSCDRVDLLDFDYMAAIGQAAGAAAAALLDPIY